MLKYRECSIEFTNICNIKCDHCYVSYPANRRDARAQVMSLDKLRSYLELVHCGGVEKINLTGGEPLLFFERLESAIRIVNEVGCNPTVVTSAFWAYNDQITEKIMQSLTKVGLTEIHLSSDRFHSRNIPPDNVFRVCQTSVKLGIPAYVFMTYIPGDSHNYFLKKRFTKYKIPVIEQSLLTKTSHDLTRLEKAYGFKALQEKIKDGPCCAVLNPFVDVSGKMFICCSPIVEMNVESTYFLCNLNDKTVSYTKLSEDHLLSHYLLDVGIFKLCKRIFPEIDDYIARSGFTNTCSLCHSVLGTRRYLPQIRHILKQYTPRNKVIYSFQEYPVSQLSED